jgi:anthranilate synthase component 1
MQLFPKPQAFETAYKAGRNQVVWTTLVADLDTPVSLMMKLTNAGENSFILESVTGGEIRGRYSIIGAKPDLIWTYKNGEVCTNSAALYDTDAYEVQSDDALTSLRSIIAASHIDLPDALPPMAAGLFGYLGYDMIREVEHLPNVNPDPLQLPDAVMIRPTVVVVIDTVKGEISIVSPAWVSDGLNAKAAYAQAAERVASVAKDLERPIATQTREITNDAISTAPVSNTTKDRYFEIVAKARDYIKKGDIFQVVPSQRWAQEFKLPPLSLYRALRRTNPSPYMFFFNFGGFQVIGASPEILVRVRDNKVSIRPIAGTRPRGANRAEDEALEKDLLSDPKELAEHLMLLDLGRNDVGRVSKIGTVDPNEQFIVEHYSHVMHIVSNVEGELSDEHDALSALLAGLPAGTVSGAPKVRAMEIIDELETEKRGIYGGGVGYFSANGDMDLCIALRTGVLKDETLYIQAGGGVVWDSDPEAEYQETVNKAKALVTAANEASRFVALKGN